MGLDSAAVTFLCAARAAGVDFTRTATLGRQAFFPGAESLRRVFATLGVREDPAAYVRAHDFGEHFFALLGAREVTSVDASGYERADVVHDLNEPLPPQLRERFTTVHDGGTLEHVFNVPQAFKSCMEMVEVGGHFTQVTVANNYMGHGFWQLSPELLFRVFSPANGFRVKAVLLREGGAGERWFSVADPDQVRSRVELRNSRPTYILTIARRVARAEIFAETPQQSDYVARWGQGENGPGPRRDEQLVAWRAGEGRLLHGLRSLPARRVARVLLHRLRLRPADPFDAPCYRRIAVDALLRGELAPPTA